MVTVGVPTATAICTGALSIPINKLHFLRTAANSPREVFPARL